MIEPCHRCGTLPQLQHSRNSSGQRYGCPVCKDCSTAHRWSEDVALRLWNGNQRRLKSKKMKKELKDRGEG